VLGAVVSPPDAVAPMAIVKRLALPSRIIAILEGEGLVNDATALILFGFAAAAVTTGSISVGTAAISFLSIVAGELAWGLAVGWATLHVRHRSGGPQVEITLALLTPFLAFWPPHALGGSGVLATVAAGLYVSWNGPRFIQPATRLQGFFVWNLVVFLIEGLLFLVTGLQARQIVQSLSGSAWQQYLGAALIISLVVVIVRFMWVFPATYLPRYLVPRLFSRHPAPNWRTPFVISFTGVRGVVSLGAALSIPVLMAGQPFPERDLILFVTFFVILVTLIGQGLSLPWLVRRLGLATEGRREAMAAKRRELGARVEGVDAVLAQLDEMERRGAPAALVKTLRRRHTDRRAHLAATADEAIPGSPAAEEAMLQLQLVEAERARIARLYAAAAIDDDARRRIERELDLEDARVHHAAESASGFSDEELCLAMRNGGDPAHGFPAAV
jgi:Na+/H+ antiporter